MLVIEHHKPLIGQRVNSATGDYTVTDATILFGDSLADMQHWLATTERKWDANSSHKNYGGKSWDLGVGWDGAMNLARDGWSDGARDLFDRLQATPAATDKEPAWRFDVAGYLPDVTRFLSGDPMNMRGKGKTKGRAPVIHLVVNGSASASVGAKEMANYGTAIVAMIDRLEASGRRIELDVYFCGRFNAQTAGGYGWKVKRASEPVDLAAIAFSIGHPAAFRRLGFALKERMPKNYETWGYGWSADIIPEFLPDTDTHAFLLDGIRHNPDACSTVPGAIKFAAEQINKAAGETLIELEELKEAA